MVKISKTSFFVAVLLLLLESCTVGFNEFQNSYKTNRLNFAYCDALKLSGYYSGEKRDIDGEEYTETMFLYTDGTVFSPSFLPSKSLLDGSFISKYFASAGETKYAWGYYNCKNDSIIISAVVPLSAAPFGGEYKKSQLIGKVSGDNLSFYQYDYNGRSTLVSKTYVFTPIAKKPDSSNYWMK